MRFVCVLLPFFISCFSLVFIVIIIIIIIIIIIYEIDCALRLHSCFLHCLCVCAFVTIYYALFCLLERMEKESREVNALCVAAGNGDIAEARQYVDLRSTARTP